jgi:hypothetical protein
MKHPLRQSPFTPLPQSYYLLLSRLEPPATCHRYAPFATWVSVSVPPNYHYALL